MKIFMFFLLFFASPPLFAQATFKVMTYNVENFFDTRDNPTKNDDEFLPSGNRYWTQSRYYHKLQQIAKVISAAGEWSTPALIALCDGRITDILSLKAPIPEVLMSLFFINEINSFIYDMNPFQFVFPGTNTN